MRVVTSTNSMLLYVIQQTLKKTNFYYSNNTVSINCFNSNVIRVQINYSQKKK